MPVLHVLRVFTDERGGHGNPLGVFLDGPAVAPDERQSIATELGFSETVFVEDAERGELQIFTPGREILFAGHPTVGAAWLLAREGFETESLRPRPGAIPVRREQEMTYVTAPAAWCPEQEYREHPDPEAVGALDPSAAGGDEYNWAWVDDARGTVRARGFYPGFAIEEDEATGSAALALCVRLGRAIEVRQGAGSVIRARPVGDGRGEIGGRVVLDERRDA